MMLKPLLFALSLVLGLTAAQADTRYPALFDVSGVEIGDVLNLRATPSASSAIAGGLPPDAKGVEVVGVSEDGKWGLIATGEGNAWVALRFLTAQPAKAGLPGPLLCLGTEPFWSLRHDGRAAEWSTPETPAEALSVVPVVVAPEGYLVAAQSAAGQTLQMLVSRENCSDGMSDRQFGFAARLFRHGAADANQLLRGCCTLDQRR